VCQLLRRLSNPQIALGEVAVTEETAIRVLVVDDHALVRRGIQALLAEIEGIEVVGEAADGQQAMTQADALNPDVILMDLVMPNMDGIEATRRITAGETGPRVLVLTSFAGDDKVFPAIKAGALGYLLKDSEPADLVQSSRSIAASRRCSRASPRRCSRNSGVLLPARQAPILSPNGRCRSCAWSPKD
jgi:DNA-binding NarL/FixJ family response regulator